MRCDAHAACLPAHEGVRLKKSWARRISPGAGRTRLGVAWHERETRVEARLSDDDDDVASFSASKKNRECG